MSRYHKGLWEVFANQSENFSSFATHSLLSLARIEGEQRNCHEVPPPSYLEVTAGQEDTRINLEAYNESLQTQRKVADGRNPFDSESTGNPFSSESIGNPFGLESAGNPFDSEFARNPFDYDFNKIQKY